MHEDIGRHILPIPDRAKISSPAYDARDAEAVYERIEPIRPPEGAPNILLILLDDAGFGSNSAFGGPCRTPTFERLAADGLRYTRFHTTAMCSPTRQALLTGRNHHSVGMGASRTWPQPRRATRRVRPNTAATIAETLRLNGYSTAQFGKCHEVPTWEWSPMGPFDRWPTGQRIRVLLRLHRRRDEPVLSESDRGHDAGRAGPDARGGLPPHRGPRRQGAAAGSASSAALMPDKPFFSTSRRARPTHPSTSRRRGATGTEASSTRAGTWCARRRSRARSSSASSRLTAS